MNRENQIMANITYGDYSVDSAKLPEVSLISLLTKGLAHYLGNEVSSKTIAALRRLALDAYAKENGAAAEGETKKAIEADTKFDRENGAHVSLQAELRATALQALLDGTVGEASPRGPAKSPLEAEIAAIVKRECLALVKNENVAIGGTVHKGRKDPEASATFNILGTELTWSEMQARYAIGKHSARINKEAQAKIDADARKAAKMLREASEANGNAAELGL